MLRLLTTTCLLAIATTAAAQDLQFPNMGQSREETTGPKPCTPAIVAANNKIISEADSVGPTGSDIAKKIASFYAPQTLFVPPKPFKVLRSAAEVLIFYNQLISGGATTLDIKSTTEQAGQFVIDRGTVIVTLAQGSPASLQFGGATTLQGPYNVVWAPTSQDCRIILDEFRNLAPVPKAT